MDELLRVAKIFGHLKGLFLVIVFVAESLFLHLGF